MWSEIENIRNAFPFSLTPCRSFFYIAEMIATMILQLNYYLSKQNALSSHASKGVYLFLHDNCNFLFQ